MTNRELQLLVQKWSEEAFKRPFEHSAVFNQRLKTTGGRYHLADHHIDVNPLMYEEYDLATLKKVVLHELCHYHLHLSGRGYRHRDRDFRLLLKQVGGSRYAPPTTKGRRPTGAIIGALGASRSLGVTAASTSLALSVVSVGTILKKFKKLLAHK